MSGGPAIAAMALTGEPLMMKAIPGPEPKPTSTASAAMACCSLASPPKPLISMSRPFLAKIPTSLPTLAGTKENASRPTLPTRMRSAADAADAVSQLAASEATIVSAVLILPLP